MSMVLSHTTTASSPDSVSWFLTEYKLFVARNWCPLHLKQSWSAFLLETTRPGSGSNPRQPRPQIGRSID